MQCDFTVLELAEYTSRQLNTFFPDRHTVSANDLQPFVATSLERVDTCFRHVRWPSYSVNGEARFNPHHSDQYCAYLYLLSNTLFREQGDLRVAAKLFGLNKALHAFNCMYDTQLPEIFWLVHVVGTVLGKANYGNHLVVLQNCTIGAVRGEFPTLNERLILSAGCSIIGPCRIGYNVTVGAGVHIYKKDVPDHSIVTAEPNFILKPNSPRPISSFFHVEEESHNTQVSGINREGAL